MHMMAKRRNAIGVAAAVLLPLGASSCAQAGGSESVATESMAQEVADSQQNLPGSATGVGRLRWAAENVSGGERTFDLCDDADAIEAGLDGGDLEADRKAMGVDCVRGRGLRFGHLSSSGEIALGRDKAKARLAVEELSRGEADGVGRRPSYELAERDLGYFGPSLSSDDFAGVPTGGELSVVSATVHLQGSSLRGLIRNDSTDSFFRSVSVTDGERVSGKFPFVLQPGEVAPFEINDWKGDVPPASALKVSAKPAPGVDRSRSILITGTPGLMEGSSAEVTNVMAVDVGPLPDGDVLYFETALEAVRSTSHPGVRVAGLRGRDIGALVAFYDERGRVIEVEPLAIDVVENGPLKDDRMLFGFVGFLVPAEAVDYSIWVGGMR